MGVFVLAFCALMVAMAGQMVYTTIAQTLPVSEEDVRAAVRKVELEKRLAEASEARWLMSDRAKVERDIAAANVEAHRTSLGLAAQPVTSSVGGLAALLGVASENLFTIAALMFLAYLVPTFASQGEPWRLALNIAAIVVLSGLFALIREITSQTVAQVKYSEVMVTVSSASVGLYLMLFGTMLAGFSLHMLRKPAMSVGGEG